MVVLQSQLKGGSMRTVKLLLAAALVSGGCSDRNIAGENAGASNAGAPAEAEAPARAADRWDLQSSGEGVALALLSGPGNTAIRMFCPAGKKELLVNVPSFRAIGSEERL